MQFSILNTGAFLLASFFMLVIVKLMIDNRDKKLLKEFKKERIVLNFIPSWVLIALKDKAYKYAVHILVGWLLSQGKDILNDIEDTKFRAIEYIKKETDGYIEEFALLLFDTIWTAVLDEVVSQLEEAGLNKVAMSDQPALQIRTKTTNAICNRLEVLGQECSHA